MGALPTKYDDVYKDKEKVIITIQYCGGWGYRVFYREAKVFLYRQEFGRYVKIKSLRDTRTTGNFQIRLLHPWKKSPGKKNGENGTAANEQQSIVLHSKKSKGGGGGGGDWLLRTREERERLVSRIDAILMEPWPDHLHHKDNTTQQQ